MGAADSGWLRTRLYIVIYRDNICIYLYTCIYMRGLCPHLSAIKKCVVYIVCTMTPRYSNILTCINQYMIIVLYIYIYTVHYPIGSRDWLLDDMAILVYWVMGNRIV